MKKGKRNPFLVSAGVVSLLLVSVIAFFAARSGQAEEGSPVLEYPQFAPTPTVSAKPNNGPSTASAPVFADQFSADNLAAQWEIVDLNATPLDEGTIWEVKDGALFQNRTNPVGNPSEQETLALVKNGDLSNYTVSAKVYDETNATFGLVARRQGESFYRFRMIANQYEATPKVVLEKVIDGVATPLAMVDGPGYTQRQWYTLSLTVNGDVIEASVDGKVVVSASDTTLTTGQAGVYTRAFGGIRFDDVTVSRA
jgi:hypothetical protein